MTGEELQARVLHRDGLVIVLDKPAGLPVHAGPKGGPNLEALFDALRFGLPRRPSLAHRLDKDTSGCLVLGRHRKALARLGNLFKAGRVGKLYWALVEGQPEGEAGTIDLPLATREPGRGWWMTPDPAGLPAVTRWRVLGRGAGCAWLALEPQTGRTHQLRVHCAASGFAIVGDPIYGSAARAGGPPLHLHARQVTLPLKSEAPLAVAAPVPAHMAAGLAGCGWAGEPQSQPQPFGNT